jgi:hypothetical protein
MISIHIMLWIFILLFAIIGAVRGWAKELLVTFSVILALFSLNVFQTFVPFFKEVMRESSPATAFWIRTGIVTAWFFSGIKPQNCSGWPKADVYSKCTARYALGRSIGRCERVHGFWHGLVLSSHSRIPLRVCNRPRPGHCEGLAALTWINYLPPSWLMGNPAIYFAVAICFIFIVVVFI